MTENFKVGDRVTCTDRGLSKYIQNGMEYVVAGLANDPDTSWFMVSVINDSGKEERYLACRFKKVEEEPEMKNFKVGDHVICVDADDSAYYLTNGDGYVVKESFYDEDLKRSMVVIDGIKSSFYSSRFKKAESKETEMVNFKVGDKVVCVRAEGGDRRLVDGNVYEVRKMYPSHGRTMVDLIYPGGFIDFHYADRFKKVEEEKEMTYDFIETKKSIKPNSTLYRLLKISNGVTLKNHVRLSFHNCPEYMALNSSEIEELINRLKAVKEILDSNN